MLEAFVFPVSAIMKLWHWLMADVFSLDNSTAWVISIILLVVTVRSLIAPFTWSLYKSGRMSMLMRPEKAEINAKYAEQTSAEAIEAEKKETAALHKKYGFHPLAGCVPPLIQIPAILGLYRLLLWLSRPNLEHSNTIGLLDAADIASFRSAEFFGAPLPAFFTMPDEALAALGTTSDEVRSVIIPLLILAIIFTTSNLWISVARGYTVLVWSSRVSRGMMKMSVVLACIMPFFILLLGLSGALPVALLMYWVGNNLWTATQTVLFWVVLVRRYPLDDVHREFNDNQRATVKQELADKKSVKRDRRARKRRALRHPSTIGQVRRELADEKQAARQAKKDDKERRKALREQRSRAQLEARKRQKLAEREKRQEQKVEET
ncbi:membrane protein insertase YidC [Corynebacterium cystitidis]|uniref:membrane protein insertase YidC n=1 Tax=Corynebacterium cystitidis TaxID=35757 RepID=UPI00211F2CB5|nr:membrane protein insertase YidC [Corynebacterium cystitidis]